MPPVSVVITCYCEGELIYRALNSLKTQSLQGFEIVVINDSSTDELTNKICNEVQQKGIAVYRTAYNMGPSGARNYGILLAKGDIIIPLDADDSLPNDAVEYIHNCFEDYPECDFVYGNYNRINLPENVSILINCSQITNNSNELKLKELLENWILLGMTPHRKTIWQKVGGYSMKYSYTCQDVDFQIRAILKGAKFHFLNKTIYNWYRSSIGINSSEKNKLALIQCWYDNIDFIINNSKNYKEGFKIALKNNDYAKIKEWANHEIGKKNLSILVLIFYLSPLFLYQVLIILYSSIKQFLRKNNKSN